MKRFLENAGSILDRYLPTRGEGDSMASQAVTAVNKIDFGWYNDGDVFDNTWYLEGWENDLSSYANWLYDNIPETAPILNSIQHVKTDSEYRDLIQKLKNIVYNEELLRDLENQPVVGSIYDYEGPFEFDNTICPECGAKCSKGELNEYGSCYDCYQHYSDDCDEDYNEDYEDD